MPGDRSKLPLRAAEEIALQQVAPRADQDIPLADRLDALGYDEDPKLAAQLGHRGHQQPFRAILSDAPHQRHVELHHVGPQLQHAREPRVARAEIVDPQFLYFALSERAPDLPRLAGRTAIPIVNKALFSEFLVRLPPVIEQLQIAEILYVVDRKIESEEAVLASLKQLFEGLLPDLITGRRRVTREVA